MLIFVLAFADVSISCRAHGATNPNRYAFSPLLRTYCCSTESGVFLPRSVPDMIGRSGRASFREKANTNPLEIGCAACTRIDPRTMMGKPWRQTQERHPAHETEFVSTPFGSLLEACPAAWVLGYPFL